MARTSPLRSAQVDSVPACGKLLRKGQSITVLKSAVGRKERAAISRGRLALRPSNKADHIQVVCTLE